MDSHWTLGKHILITGASSGIGKELCFSLSGAVKTLTLVSRNEDKLVSLKAELVQLGTATKINYFAMDINDRVSAESLISKIYDQENDQIDALINAAGGSPHFGLFETMSHKEIEDIFSTNACAPLHLLRILLPRMKLQPSRDDSEKRAQICMLSSRSAERVLPNLVVYGAAKAAIEGMVEGLRREYARHGIVFTLVNPGSIDTSFADQWSKEIQDVHTKESMPVKKAILPILQALNVSFGVNKVSYESVEQWISEAGVLK